MNVLNVQRFSGAETTVSDIKTNQHHDITSGCIQQEFSHPALLKIIMITIMIIITTKLLSDFIGNAEHSGWSIGGDGGLS